MKHIPGRSGLKRISPAADFKEQLKQTGQHHQRHQAHSQHGHDLTDTLELHKSRAPPRCKAHHQAGYRRQHKKQQRHQQRRPHGIRVLIVNPRAQVPAHKSGHQRCAQGSDIKLQISLLLMSEYHAQRSKHRSQQRHHIAEPVNRAVLLRVDLHCVCRPVSHG